MSKTNETANVTFSDSQVAEAKKFIEGGASFSAIATTLVTINVVKNGKEAAALLDFCGKQKGTRQGVYREKMVAFLEEGLRTEAEFADWIVNEKKENLRYLSGDNYIRRAFNRLHEKIDPEAAKNWKEVPYVKPAKEKEIVKADNGKDNTEAVAPQETPQETARKGRGRGRGSRSAA